MAKLKDKMSTLFAKCATRLRALTHQEPAPAPKPQPEPPARDLLTRGAMKIHKIGKPLNWQ